MATPGADHATATFVGVSVGTTLITAAGPGFAHTGSGGLVSDTAVLTVNAPIVARIDLTSPSPSVLIGRTLQLTATAKDTADHALANRQFTWESSDPAKATVSSGGLVTAVALGPFTVTVTDKAAGKSASISLVTLVPVSTVEVNPPSTFVYIGEQRTFQLDLRDGSGNALAPANRTIVWNSTTPTVATIGQDGVATGVSAGFTTITATVEGKSGSATLFVERKPSSVDIVPTGSTIVVGQSLPLTATLYDAQGTAVQGATFGWQSANPAIASVSTSGVVSGVAAGGPVTITATETQSGKTGTASITVLAVPVASVTVSPPGTTLSVGGSVQLSAITRDAQGTILSGRAVTWQSLTPSVASVSASGFVSALGAGSATIVATAEGVSGSATITVTAAPPAIASITVTPSPSTIIVGQTLQLSAVPRDGQGNILSGRALTWQSASPGVASVSASGLVTAIAAGGPVQITATAEGVTGSASVTVNPVPPRFAFARFDNPSIASGAADPAFAFTSSGGAITLVRSAPGNYHVTFEGLAAATFSEAVLVSTFGQGVNYCHITSRTLSAGNLIADVGCFTGHGYVRADNEFLITVLGTQLLGARYGFAVTNGLSTQPSTPSIGYNITPTGVQPITAKGTDNYYVVRFTGNARAGGNAEAVLVSATDVQARCVTRAGFASDTVAVYCGDLFGAGAGMFSIALLDHGRAGQRFGLALVPGDDVTPSLTIPASDRVNSSGGAVVRTRTGKGLTEVKFVGLGGNDRLTMQVTPVTDQGAAYCKVLGWSSAGADLTVTVQCYHEDGSVDDVPYFIVVMQ